MGQKYDFEQIPAGWKFCFNGNCPKHGDCLRYQAATELPEDREWGQAVFPAALKDGECRFFRNASKVRMATGFLVAGNMAMSQRFVAMRRVLTSYLGSNGTYYLYRNGKKWLSPSQQEDISQLFRKAGYEEEVAYGAYKMDYDFT